MSRYDDCMTKAIRSLGIDPTKEQVIQAANGIYLADAIAEAIDRIEVTIEAGFEKALTGDNHHYGLISLLDTLTTKGKADTK